MKRLRSEVVSMEAKESLNKTLRFVKEVKDTLGGGETQEYHQFLNLFLDFHANRITIDALLTRLTQLFYGHKHLILMFNALHSKNGHDDNNNDIGNKSSISSNNNDIGNKSSSNNKNYTGNNKSGSSSSNNNNIGDYEDGSEETPSKEKIIKRDFANKFSSKRISKGGECANRLFLDTILSAYDREEEGDVVASDENVYQQRVAVTISEKHPDLRDHDRDVLDDQLDACCCGEKTTPPNDKIIKKKLEYKDAIDFFTRISKRLLKYEDEDDERAYRLLLDTMAMFGKRQVTASGVYSRVGLILEKYPDLFEEFKDYFLSEEFSEEELRYTPIYLILPAKSKDKDDDHQDQEEVFNNINVSVSSAAIIGNSDRKEEYGDLCEDQLLEMDLLLQTLISTIHQLKQCLPKLKKKNTTINIEQHLSLET